MHIEADECPLCFEAFTKTPLLITKSRQRCQLPCSGKHALCERCLHDMRLQATLADQKELSCPLCNGAVPVHALTQHKQLMVVIDGCNVSR